MIRLPLPVFLAASLVLHGVWLLQPSSANKPVWSGQGTTPLQVSIIKPVRKSAGEDATRLQYKRDDTDIEKSAVAVTRPVNTPARNTSTVGSRTRKTDTDRFTKIPARHHHARQRFDVGQARDKLGSALKKRLDSEFQYPWLARKRGWQGNVTLSLRIQGDGQLSDIQISRTSGYTILDNSALASANSIGMLPEAVDLLHGNTLTLQIPVHYRLLDG